MAAIRRTLSPVPRPGSIPNGEASLVASPLSRSSLFPHNLQTPICIPPPAFTSFDYAFYKVQGFVLGLFSKRYSRPLERLKPKGQVRKRFLLQFLMCFVIGVFYGLTPFASMNSPMNIMSNHQAFSFKGVRSQLRNATALSGSFYANEDAKLVPHDTDLGIHNETNVGTPVNQSLTSNLTMEVHKLLIIVTPTHAQPSQGHNLNRLAHTLKLVPPPLLWIVVDMGAQSKETAEVLRQNGVMYRHVVCKKNLSHIIDRSVHQRNVALSHIETHRLDGIVYFADDDNVYSVDMFEEMRQISRFGTWVVAKLTESSDKVILEGPTCNGTQVTGWHTNEVTGQSRRFHAELSGFAFNSTILWDQKLWQRSTLKPIRQLDTVNKAAQVSTFIEQVVEDESQMECLPFNPSKVMVWDLEVEPIYSFPFKWSMKNKNLDVTVPLA